LGVLVSATAGWIGYMIQQSLRNALEHAGVDRQVLTTITQTLVDRNDPNAVEPTKPIGHVLTDGDAQRFSERGITVGRDAKGRWRRLAPSPIPLDVPEAPAVKQLVDEGKIVIAGGGGGSPVYLDEQAGFEGIEAVADKDRVAAILAVRLHASCMIILTNVDGVYRGWGTPEQELLRELTLAEAEQLLEAETLGRGSMRPKIEAAVTFLRAGGDRAIIAHLQEGRAALSGETGTTIRRDDS
jgi:carbamate kinase